MYLSGALSDSDTAILGVIEPDINLLERIVAPVSDNDNSLSGLSIVRILDRLGNKDNYYNPREEVLDRIYVRLENFVMESNIITKKEEILTSLRYIFDHYHRISGNGFQNKFYRTTRLTLFKVAEELRKVGLIDNMQLSQIEAMVSQYTSESFELRELYRGGKKRLNWVPDPNALSEKIDIILEAAQGKLSATNPHQATRIYNKLATNLDAIRDDYIKFLDSAKNGLGLLENQPNTPRRLLMHGIIISLAKRGILNQILAKKEPMKVLSNVIFGDDEGLRIFLTFNYRNNPNEILSIYNRFSYDAINRFRSLGLTVTKTQVANLKKDTLNLIRGWFFSNPYDLLYVNENPRRALQPIEKSDLYPEFDFVSAALLMNSVHKENPNIKFTELRNYGTDIFKKLLTKSETLSQGSWRRIFDGMLYIWNDDKVSHPERLPLYRKCIKEAVKYAKLMEYSLVTPARPSSYTSLWNDPYVMAYDVIMSLGMFHGIDPFTFDMLDDSVFSRSKGMGADKFTRHEPFDKTINPFGHILTASKLNTGIYKRLRKSQQRLGLRLLKELMIYEEFDAQGNLLDIDKTHIEKVYGTQNSWIYNRWFSNKYFQDNLKALNHLRKEIRQKPLDQYFKDNWKVVHNRFWVNIFGNSKSQCDLYFLIYELEKLGDDLLVQDILSIDFPNFLGEILSDHGFPSYP